MKLTPHQQRFLWRLILDPSPANATEANSLGLNPTGRSEMVKAGLIREVVGAGKRYTVQDRGWGWATENLGDIAFPISPKSAAMLQTIARKLGGFLAKKGFALAQIFDPDPGSLAAQVERTYLSITGGKWDQRVRFKELKKALPDVPIAEIHKVANQWMTDGRLFWSPLDSPRERGRDDDEVALFMGRERVDLIYLRPVR